MRLKIKRRQLPYRTLNEYDQTARAEFDRLLTVSRTAMAHLITHSQPDWETPQILNTQAPLTKSTGPKPNQDLERRRQHGAPLSPDHLDQRTKDRLLHTLPARAGTVHTAGPSLAAKPEATWTQEEVPLDSIASAPDLDMRRLRTALDGRSQDLPLAVRDPDTGLLALQEGQEEAFAHAVAYVPALTMMVTIDARPVTQTGGFQLSALVTLGKEITRPNAYRLSSEMEPLAQVARSQDLAPFLLLAQGQETQAATAARAAADRKELERNEAWLTAFNKARSDGSPIAVAEATANQDPEFKRLLNVSQGLAKVAARLEAEQDDRTAAFTRAKLETEQYLGHPIPDDMDYEALWHEARKGIIA